MMTVTIVQTKTVVDFSLKPCYISRKGELMKLLLFVFLVLGLSGCSYGLLTPDVLTQLKDDKASVCFVTEGGPVGIAAGIIAFCRANSDSHSTLEVTPEGNLKVDHNISK